MRTVEKLWDHNNHPIRKVLKKRTFGWQEIWITPRVATRWVLNSLELSKDTKRRFNRPIWRKQVEDVIELIRQGKFPEAFSEDPIAIGTTKWGRVICNGQHRIVAIALSGQTVKTRVYLNEPFRRTELWSATDWKEALDPDFELIPEPKWLKGGDEWVK